MHEKRIFEMNEKRILDVWKKHNQRIARKAALETDKNRIIRNLEVMLAIWGGGQ